MADINLKLKLFGGRPIDATGYGEIVPLKIREVIDIGYMNYMKYLNILTLNVEDFLGEPNDEVHILDLLILFGGEEIEKMFEESLSLFLDGSAVIDKDQIKVFIKKDNGKINVVTKDNYHSIQEVIKWQNYINNFEEKKLDNFKPADEETKRLKERMDRLAKERDELKRKKKSNEEGESDQGDIDFYDIISSISSRSFGINELNVLDLTMFQVYRKFKRLEIIDQYDISIKSILAGAKDIKIRHWSSKD